MQINQTSIVPSSDGVKGRRLFELAHVVEISPKHHSVLVESFRSRTIYKNVRVAGKGYWLPQVGDLVLLAFVEGQSEQPIVLDVIMISGDDKMSSGDNNDIQINRIAKDEDGKPTGEGAINLHTDKYGDVHLTLNGSKGNLFIHAYGDEGRIVLNSKGKTILNADGDVEIDASGKTHIQTMGQTDIESDGDLTITGRGDTTITTTGKTEIISKESDTNILTELGNTSITTVEGTTAIQSKGNITITTEGDTSISTTGKTTIESDGDIDVTGSTVNLSGTVTVANSTVPGQAGCFNGIHNCLFTGAPHSNITTT